jgi:hypothetical protein
VSRSPLCIGPLVPFVCTYTRGGRRYGITLYATSEALIIETWGSRLKALTIDGVLA